ncbi:MAG TPA: alpha-L-arabinofuranosidase [Opitutaceae bacterium]|nr:alpha-L-arabinofuranosidase [Opitutaceae bacterium]
MSLQVFASAQSNLAIYDDALVNGWQNWSWASVDTASTANVHSGTNSIAVTASAWSALYLHHDPIDTSGYTDLVFWINGGATGGQTLKVSALLSDTAQNGVMVGPLAANTWQKVTLSLTSLGVANQPNLTGIWVQEATGADQPTFYVDDAVLAAIPPPSSVNVTVDFNSSVRRVDPRVFGVNTAIWDGSFGTPTTAGLLKEIKIQALRYPGGSASDEYHWQTNMSEGQTFQWATNFDTFAGIAKGTKADVFITVNYGTGTPEEAAAWVRYSNKQKHYGFKFWEVGNENYGTWEADKNTRPNDPVTYATRFKDYYNQMKSVDRSIKVGAVVVTGEDSQANYTDHPVINPRTGVTHNGWTPVMLATMKTLGVTPDFVIYHRYAQGPFGESDSYLLTSSTSWANDADNLRQMLNDYLGSDAAKVELTCTENNSVYAQPGKQTTSLVNGLFLADSLGNLMKTEFNALIWWDFRNGQEPGNNNSASLYGWRQYGDYGIVTAATPAGPADRYPTFYVQKLLKYYARGGETVLNATSDYVGLAAYAVRRPNGSLRVLLINKLPSTALTTNITINGFNAGKHAVAFSYGIPQDEAARTGTGSADVAKANLKIKNGVSYSAGPYSATVLRFHRDGTPDDTDCGEDGD